MTTTVKALGGGAQPASIDTSGRVAGGSALRVYGFDSEADAIAAGYVCEGGPAMSVSLITDAQIASGAWKAEGDPAALVVYTAPSNMPVEGGYALPVYSVNGWGSGSPTPGPTLPEVSSATLLLDLRASQLSLSNNDPVSTWPDVSGNGNDFSQSTSAYRPIYLANYEGSPALWFPSADPDWIPYSMIGPDFADNLDTFAVFVVAKYDGNNGQNVINKQLFVDQRGWSVDVYYSGNNLRNSFALNTSVLDYIDTLGGLAVESTPVMAVHSFEKLSPSVTHAYVNGDNSGEFIDTVGTPGSVSVNATVHIGIFEDAQYGTFSGWIRAILIYQITDTDSWPTDRAAIEAWLATNP